MGITWNSTYPTRVLGYLILYLDDTRRQVGYLNKEKGIGV